MREDEGEAAMDFAYSWGRRGAPCRARQPPFPDAATPESCYFIELWTSFIDLLHRSTLLAASYELMFSAVRSCCFILLRWY